MSSPQPKVLKFMSVSVKDPVAAKQGVPTGQLPFPLEGQPSQAGADLPAQLNLAQASATHKPPLLAAAWLLGQGLGPIAAASPYKGGQRNRHAKTL